MFGLGVGEIVIVALVAVLLFGSQLPKIARSLGSSIVEFKRGVQGVDVEVKSTVHEVQKLMTEVERDRLRSAVNETVGNNQKAV